MGREKEREGGELKGAAGAAGNADDAFAVVVKFCSARKDIMCDAAAFFTAFKAFFPRSRSEGVLRVAAVFIHGSLPLLPRPLKPIF